MTAIMDFLDDVGMGYLDLTKHAKYNWQWLGLRSIQIATFPIFLLLVLMYFIVTGIYWAIDSTPRGKS